MCGRFALTLPQDAVAAFFDARPVEGFALETPRYNICPTQSIAAISTRDGARTISPMRWGFIPSWFRTPEDGPLLINARAETIHEKKAFATACRETRCLIPASGFFEWKASEASGAAPYFVRPEGGGLVAFAGIWRSWRDSGGRERATCAIVTCAANGAIAEIHHRMPVPIAPEDFGLWLGERGRGAATLMRAPVEDFFALHPVSRAVNGRGRDGPELIAPAPEFEPQPRLL